MDKLVREATIQWKEVMDYYLGFMEALVSFQAIPDVSPDLFGPEMQLVFSRGLHRQKPVYVIEHLEWEHVQKGELSHLIPREPEPEEPVEEVDQSEGEEDTPEEEAPLEPEGGSDEEDDSSPPTKKSTAKKKSG